MMENAELIDEIYERSLAERAIVCKGWIWGAGMLVSLPPEKGSEKRTTRRLIDGESVSAKSGVLPILRDAPTRGCLLAIVRRAYNADVLVVPDVTSRTAPSWRILAKKGLEKKLYATEAEALVAALEAADGY